MFPELVEPEDPGIGDVAWAAGIFEGEGTITWSNGPRLCLYNSDRWVVEKFLRVIGIGKIYGPYEPNHLDHWQRKPRYVWQVGGWKKCQYILDLSGPGYHLADAPELKKS